MRKNLYLGLIACAALTMTGCSNNEVIENAAQQSGKAIQFSTYLGKSVQGRAAALTTATLSDFGVFASYEAGAGWAEGNKMNFMYNQKVVKKVVELTTTWEYTPLKYWPEKNGEKISFFAYAPYTNNEETPANSIIPPANTKTGAPVLGFAISNDVTRMVDFTAGVKMDVTTQDNDAPAVSFNLKHELARVNFAAKLDRTGFDSEDANKTKVNITNVKIDKGDYFYASANYTFGTTEDSYEGSWSEHQKRTEDLVADAILDKKAAEDLGTYSTTGVFVSDATTAVPMFTNGDYLFLIPTPTIGILAENMVYVTITYDIVTADAALADGYVKSTATKTVGIAASNFEQGVAKNYTFTIGLHEIKVTPTVEAWNTDTEVTGPTVDGSSSES